MFKYLFIKANIFNTEPVKNLENCETRLLFCCWLNTIYVHLIVGNTLQYNVEWSVIFNINFRKYLCQTIVRGCQSPSVASQVKVKGMLPRYGWYRENRILRANQRSPCSIEYTETNKTLRKSKTEDKRKQAENMIEQGMRNGKNMASGITSLEKNHKNVDQIVDMSHYYNRYSKRQQP